MGKLITMGVTLSGGGPWGFSLKGSNLIEICRLVNGGIAEVDGHLKLGDRIICINGCNITSREEAVQLVQTSGNCLSLTIERFQSESDSDCAYEERQQITSDPPSQFQTRRQIFPVQTDAHSKMPSWPMMMESPSAPERLNQPAPTRSDTWQASRRSSVGSFGLPVPSQHSPKHRIAAPSSLLNSRSNDNGAFRRLSVSSTPKPMSSSAVNGATNGMMAASPFVSLDNRFDNLERRGISMDDKVVANSAVNSRGPPPLLTPPALPPRGRFRSAVSINHLSGSSVSFDNNGGADPTSSGFSGNSCTTEGTILRNEYAKQLRRAQASLLRSTVMTPSNSLSNPSGAVVTAAAPFASTESLTKSEESCSASMSSIPNCVDISIINLDGYHESSYIQARGTSPRLGFGGHYQRQYSFSEDVGSSGTAQRYSSSTSMSTSTSTDTTTFSAEPLVDSSCINDNDVFHRRVHSNPQVARDVVLKNDSVDPPFVVKKSSPSPTRVVAVHQHDEDGCNCTTPPPQMLFSTSESTSFADLQDCNVALAAAAAAATVDSGSNSPRPLLLHARQASAEAALCDAEANRLAQQLFDRRLIAALIPPKNVPLSYLSEFVHQEQITLPSLSNFRHHSRHSGSDISTSSSCFSVPPVDMEMMDTDVTLSHLAESLQRKRQLLLKDREELENDMSCNVQLGQRVRNILCQRCASEKTAPTVAACLRRFDKLLEQLDISLKLLFLLSSKLARIDNELHQLLQQDDSETEPLIALQNKRLDVEKRLAEAKSLKNNIDTRQDMITNMLRSTLTASEFDEFVHFIEKRLTLLLQFREVEEAVTNVETRLFTLERTQCVGESHIKKECQTS